MSRTGRPPRLLVKTLTVIFTTVALLLITVFGVVTVNMREQVRQTVAENLEEGQRVFAAFESRHQRELIGLASTLAESPTLKAAVETYAAETRASGNEAGEYLLTTIQRELEKVAARVDADAVIAADAQQNTLGSAGSLRDRWPLGHPVSLVPTGSEASSYNGVVEAGDRVFRVVAVPLLFADTAIGTLNVATSLDLDYARLLAELSGAHVVIMRNGRAIASTLRPAATAAFEAAQLSSSASEGTYTLDREPHAFRQLVDLGETKFYALDSIEASSQRAMAKTMRNLSVMAVGAGLLAFLGSLLLARLVSRPIRRLSNELTLMRASHDVHRQLPLTGSSLELDTLTETFNALLGTVAEAEAQTEAAYTGAIRALATALDARDPYTAGHSERVSVLAVAVGRELKIPDEMVDVLRLGALLHDIGKIGVPDHVLRKAGPLTSEEYDAIKEHPGLGARILRPVPFLTRHISIVELHHERPDGRGYPYGLRGDDIPLEARIVHVADAYDAMTSARAYRAARLPASALHELWRCAGTEYHAEIVRALASVLPALTTTTGVRSLERAVG